MGYGWEGIMAVNADGSFSPTARLSCPPRVPPLRTSEPLLARVVIRGWRGLRVQS